MTGRKNDLVHMKNIRVSKTTGRIRELEKPFDVNRGTTYKGAVELHPAEKDIFDAFFKILNKKTDRPANE